MKNFLKKLRSNHDFRAILIMSLSAIFNGCYGLFSITVGIISGDLYLISSGVYYLLLTIVEGLLLAKKKQVKSMRPYGFFMMLIDLSLSLMTFYALFTKGIKPQNEIVMIAIATYSFLRIGLSIKNFIGARRNSDISLIIMRSISLSCAVVGILSLTMSMLLTFGGEYDNNAIVLIGLTGMAAFLLNLLIAVYLIINKPDLLRKNKQKVA